VSRLAGYGDALQEMSADIAQRFAGAFSLLSRTLQAQQHRGDGPDLDNRAQSLLPAAGSALVGLVGLSTALAAAMLGLLPAAGAAVAGLAALAVAGGVVLLDVLPTAGVVLTWLIGCLAAGGPALFGLFGNAQQEEEGHAPRGLAGIAKTAVRIALGLLPTSGVGLLCLFASAATAIALLVTLPGAFHGLIWLIGWAVPAAAAVMLQILLSAIGGLFWLIGQFAAAGVALFEVLPSVFEDLFWLISQLAGVCVALLKVLPSAFQGLFSLIGQMTGSIQVLMVPLTGSMGGVLASLFWIYCLRYYLI
jgi:hypothetical protein